MELLETIAQSHEIEKIIKESEDYLIIVSPYLKINNRLRPKLTDCFNRCKKSIILYRENDLTQPERDWLYKFKNVDLLPIKNLHAKCYLNESTAIITSMNLYDTSQINNHEIGVKLTIAENEKEITQLLDFINTIIKTDHSTFDFSLNKSSAEEITMGDLYKELIENYDFPKKLTTDGTFDFMCEVAMKLHQFPDEDYKASGNTLLRSAKLEKSLYEKLKAELLKKASKKRSYDYAEFTEEWFKYLKAEFPNVQFQKEENIITATDFPNKGINFSNKNGFATFDFNANYDSMKRIKQTKKDGLEVLMSNYRLYWNGIARISVYHAKDIQVFEKVVEDINYCSKGLFTVLDEVKKFNI